MVNGSLPPSMTEMTGVRAWVQRQPEARRQFVKFAVVGASSTVLDLLTYKLLWFVLPAIPYAMARAAFFLTDPVGIALDLQRTAAAMASVISSGVVGTANSFYWNRRWTFRAIEHDLAIRQIRRFLFVSYTGMALRAVIVYGLMPPTGVRPSPIQVLVYQLIAILIVMFWNFFMNRLWTFRKNR